MNTIEEFIRWEQASRDTIDVKRCYIDLAGDLVAGVLLSQIIFWFLPGKEGSKLRVEHEGVLWLAKQRADWWDECRISPKQFDRAIKALADRGLIEHERFKFAGSPTVHVWLNWPAVVEGVNSILTKGINPIVPLGNLEVDQRDKSLTETTTETTSRELIKNRYGEFDNVFLTVDEHQKLADKFGTADAIEKIENLSAYKKSKGKAYKDDYATILTWARRDTEKPSGRASVETKGPMSLDKFTDSPYAHVYNRQAERLAEREE